MHIMELFFSKLLLEKVAFKIGITRNYGYNTAKLK